MLDLKEKEYEQLKKLGQKLHIPIPEAFWELEVRDKGGKVIQRHKQRSHSWTRASYNMMFCQLAGKDGNDTTWGAGYLNVKGQDGVVVSGAEPVAITYAYNSSPKSVDGTDAGYRAPATNNARGIMVGSGINAESFEDYALQTKIGHGTGAGQLSYQESQAHAKSYNATTKVMKNELVRYLNNNSGGDVSVNEVALAALGMYNAWNYGRYFVVARDKLATTVTVPNTGQLKVTYTIQLTYPV